MPDYSEQNRLYFGTDYMRTGKAAVLTPERTSAEVDRLVDLLDLKGNEKLLDVGCGWGRHVAEFACRGYNVEGIDVSKAMIMRAKLLLRENGADASISVCDASELDRPTEFDIVLSLFGSFGYANTDEGSLQILTRMRQALIQGGKLCLDLWNRCRYCEMDGQTVSHTHDGATIEESHSFDPDSGRMNIIRTFVCGDDTRQYRLSVRLYSDAELVSLLAQAGFEQVEVFGSLGGEPFETDSPKMVMVAC